MEAAEADGAEVRALAERLRQIDAVAPLAVRQAYGVIAGIVEHLPATDAFLLSPQSREAWRVIRDADPEGYLVYLALVRQRCGRHVVDLVVALVGPPRRAAPREIVLQTPEQVQARAAPAWLIRELLPEMGLAVFFGEAGSGKSFLVFDILLAIARGERWRGLRVRHGPCLMIVAEGASKARLAAYEQHHGIDVRSLPVRFIEQELSLRGAESDLDALLKKVAAARVELGPFVFSVIDTMNRTFGGGNESASDDSAQYIASTAALGGVAGGLVCVVHHSGKNASLGARGHSSLRAAADAEFEITRSAGGLRQVKNTKLRDGIDGKVFSFRLEQVDLGQHPDPDAEPGERWTSCVVVPSDDQAAPTAARSRPLPPGPTVALFALRRTIESSGEFLPATSAIPAGAKGVRTEQWLEAYKLLRPLPQDVEGKDAKREANARRTAFHRAQEQLQAARVVGTHARFWWIA